MTVASETVLISNSASVKRILGYNLYIYKNRTFVK